MKGLVEKMNQILLALFVVGLDFYLTHSTLTTNGILWNTPGEPARSAFGAEKIKVLCPAKSAMINLFVKSSR